MEQLAHIKKLAESIDAKRKQREGIEAEMNRATVVITAADTAKRKLAELKDARAQLLADAFRSNKKAETKAIDAELTTAADAVRAEADSVTAATGAAAQLQSELAQVKETLDSLEREQRVLAAQHCTEAFKDAEVAYLKAVDVMGDAYISLHAAHEAQRRVTGHGSGDMREHLRNYGLLRIFTPAPSTPRGWAEPEWLGGTGMAGRNRNGWAETEWLGGNGMAGRKRSGTCSGTEG